MKIIDHGNGIHEALIPLVPVHQYYQLGVGFGVLFGALIVGLVWVTLAGYYIASGALALVTLLLLTRIDKNRKDAKLVDKFVDEAFDFMEQATKPDPSDFN